ncbi:hypothetical protein L1D59_23890, partial [Pseudoalteromonas piscicida]|uniref:hypothetical protein n=1 Tax=Pseudoalteromonas piscicida TaxID=43662 RepID=UPI001EFD255C
IRDHYLTTINQESIDVDFKDVVAKINRSKCKFVCFASTTRTHFVLEKLGIMDIFSAVYCGTAVKKQKLDSVEDVIIKIEKKFNVDRSNMIVFDDSKYICERFSILGIKSFLVPIKGLRKNFYKKHVIPYLRKIGVFIGERV